MVRLVLVLAVAVSALLEGQAEASCAPRCDFVVCERAEEPRGLVRASVLSVTPGEFPDNPTYDAIEIEIVAMESELGNANWVGERFTFRQDGFVETAAGDEIVFWVPDTVEDGSQLRPAIFLADGADVTCEGGRASIDAIANAPDSETCLEAFAGSEPASCDDTLGCSVGGADRWPLWPLVLALPLVAARRRRNLTLAHDTPGSAAETISIARALK